MFYGGAGLVGNIVIAILFTVRGELSPDLQLLMLWILFGIGSLGATFFLFVRPVPLSEEPYRDLGATLQLIFKVFKRKELLIWLPHTASWALSLSFGWCKFPLLFPIKYVSWAFMLWGVAFFVSTYIFGRMTDKYKLNYFVAAHACIILVIIILLYAATFAGVTPMFFVIGFIFGINEAMGNNIIPLALLRTLPTEFSGASTIYRSLRMFMVGVGMGINAFVEWYWSLMILGICIIASCCLSGILYKEPEKVETLGLSSITDDTYVDYTLPPIGNRDSFVLYS